MKEQQYISFFYGNEDKSEGIELHNFECPKKAAAFLRKIANNIDQFKNSKEYQLQKISLKQVSESKKINHALKTDKDAFHRDFA